MIHRNNLRSVWHITLLIFLISLVACKSNEATSSRKEAEKKEAAEFKEIDKEYEKGVEAHFKMQSDEAKRMIRKAEKRNRKLNRHRKTSWFKRVFDSD
jgi:hypothetical protein